jgi:hypothetical protein
MPLNSLWWSNDPVEGPFRDNANGDITAATMRSFAEAVALEGSSEEWLSYVPGPANEGPPYVWDAESEAETVWLPGGGSGDISTYFTYGANGQGDAYFTYTAAIEAVVQATVSGTGLVLSGVTEGTTVAPVLWTGTLPDLASPDAGTIIGPAVEVTDDPVTLAISGTGSVRISASGASVMMGMIFTPPEGETIEVSPDSVSIDPTGVSLLIVARPAAPSSTIITD